MLKILVIFLLLQGLLHHQTILLAQLKQPNIIFIIADSHRGDALGVEGNSFIETPHLDQMAKEGIRFANSYVTTAICVVSRASILSGQHKARHQINDFTSSFSSEALQNTYPMLLKSAGYKTAQIGFFGVGKEVPKGLFDHLDDQLPWMTKDGVHNTDQITNKALQFLENYEGDSPFYLTLSFNAAHEIDGVNGNPATYLIQEKFRDKYTDVDMPIPTTAAPEYWESFPDFFRTDQNIGRQRWYGFFSTPELHQSNSKNYYRLITGIDDAVGKVLDKVKELNIDQETIIIYTSDHGFSLGEHGMMGKWYGFEKSIHVPLIIKGASEKIPYKGKRYKQLALNIDLAPTILGFAELPIPAGMQGQDLMQIIRNKKQERQSFFYEHSVFNSPLLPKVEGLISKDYKYFNYTEHQFESLYDTKKDREETKDVARDPKYTKKLNQIRQLYQTEKERIR